MRTLLGVLLVGFAALASGVGALWAFMKAAGAEVDYCPDAKCTSGWYPATGILVSALILGVLGLVTLRGRRGG